MVCGLLCHSDLFVLDHRSRDPINNVSRLNKGQIGAISYHTAFTLAALVLARHLPLHPGPKLLSLLGLDCKLSL